MTRRFPVLFVVLAFVAFELPAVQPQSPYVGEEVREIKALSPDEIDAYLGGEGMGLAKTAELNGFAGPAHVLELAAPLELTSEQHSRTEALFASMQSRARSLGHALVEEERKLDALFATRAVTPASLEAALQEVGTLQARIRAVHLAAHLDQVEILTPQQNARYALLRGYDDPDGHRAHGGQHAH